jgi:hypothetical protein
MFIKTNCGYVALSKVREVVKVGEAARIYLGNDDEGHSASLSDWRAAKYRALPMMPAAPGTMLMRHIERTDDDEDDFYLMTCIGWIVGDDGLMVPLSIYGHSDESNELLGVVHPGGRVEIYHDTEFPTLDAYREEMRARRADQVARAQKGPKAA